MTWKELKDRIEKMTSEEQERSVVGCGEETPIKDAVLAKVTEDMYYNANWDYAESESDIPAEELADPETYLIAEKGLYYLEF